MNDNRPDGGPDHPLTEGDDFSRARLAYLGRGAVTVLRRIFSLRAETDYEATIQQIRADVTFRSGNTWALVFAILIASVGLNVNSTAVIIGAMLISPLLGPIAGIGFGLATNDFPLIRRGTRNLLVATCVGLVVSALYFAVSPLQGEQSELLARTRPTLYDVVIALAGGAAGFVAVSRKDGKGNVIAGVAIATALMPPLCTAGFALVQGKLWYLLGALHLFLINALFICLATLGFARFMRFPRLVEQEEGRVLRARAWLAILAVAIGVPSIYTGYMVIREARFQNSARRFVSENLVFPDRAVVSTELTYSRDGSTISATVLGPPLPEETVTSIEQRLSSYGLRGTQLRLHQPEADQATPEQIGEMVRRGILEDIYRKNEAALGERDERIRVLEDEVIRLRASELPVRDLAKELSAIYPGLVSLGAGRQAGTTDADPDGALAPVAVLSWKKLPSSAEQERVRAFLALRMKEESLRAVHVVAR